MQKEWHDGLLLPVSYRIPVPNGCLAHGIAEELLRWRMADEMMSPLKSEL